MKTEFGQVAPAAAQSSTSSARSVSAGRAYWVAPANRGIGLRGPTVQSPLTYD